MSYKKIINNGWSQSAVIPESLRAVINQNASQSIKDDDVLIVLSQSCDLIHHDYDNEPYVEVIIASPLNSDKLDKSLFDSRNPRVLQLHIIIDGNQHLFQIKSHNKISFPRNLLEDHKPRENIKILGSNIPMWIGKKYFRPALPNNFNSRFNQEAVKKILKKNHEPIERFFLNLKSFKELEDDEIYEVEMLGVVSDKAKMVDANKLMFDLEAAMNKCTGIKALNFQARMEDDISLAVIRKYLAWTPYDYLSISE